MWNRNHFGDSAGSGRSRSLFTPGVPPPQPTRVKTAKKATNEAKRENRQVKFMGIGFLRFGRMTLSGSARHSPASGRGAIFLTLDPRHWSGEGGSKGRLRTERNGPCCRLVGVSRADHDHAAVRTGDAATDQQQIVFGVDLDHFQVANGHFGVAVSAGSLHPLFRTAGTPVTAE